MSEIMRQGELLPFGEPGVDPYLIPRPALIAFSGGRTSAYMLKHIIDAHGGTLPDDIIVSFCNTGREHEFTLDFVRECETRWHVRVYWLEFDPHAEENTKFVTYETASRDGTPLRLAIETRPTQHLYNAVSRYCTATCKVRRMQKLMHHFLGYQSWHHAMGLRADEMSRVAKAMRRAGHDRQYPVCPLATAGVNKLDVMDWWADQPFDLKLPNIGGESPLGNCVDCHLKVREKLVNILRVMPEVANWPIQQEERMEKVIRFIPQTTDGPELRHRFFNDGTSFRDLLADANTMNAAGAPMDVGYDTESIDCNCTD
jgi:3'-phosphoadenosine 5'-phosphosulfate sulfotransferase (PAPS reductase)/FAD synthetase